MDRRSLLKVITALPFAKSLRAESAQAKRPLLSREFVRAMLGGRRTQPGKSSGADSTAG